AVVINQARGFDGHPSRGHRSAAIVKASWAASSARSKSPRKPTSTATTLPQCSRKTSSRVVGTRLPVGGDGPDLDRTAEAGGGDLRGDLDRGVEVVGLEG